MTLMSHHLPRPAQHHPNVLLIHCHDLGHMVGCYGGNSAQTPHLDALAAQGALFDRHFACAPQGSPSRAGMYTGLHPNRHGLMGLSNEGVWNLKPELPNVVTVMRTLGYWPLQVGIFHIGIEPFNYGFEESLRPHDPDEIALAAIHGLEKRPRDRRFFAVVGFFEAHRPYQPKGIPLQAPESILVPPYLVDCPEGREELARFFGEVSRIDRAVGTILRWLDGQALGPETLVIFTTDHGIAMPLAKGTLYDPGLETALIMRWLGMIPEGRRIECLTSNVDFFPSLLSAIEAQDFLPFGLDGKDFWPAVVGGTCPMRQQIFAEITWHDFYQPMRCIRTETHKLIRNFTPGMGLQIPSDVLLSPFTRANREVLRTWPRPEYELYDLESDPLERHNLAGKPEVAAIEKDLKARLQMRLEYAKDPILQGYVQPPPGYERILEKWRGGLPE
ncbi:MAG: sulfatase [Chloroflexi bacterium]|nr:sulfatase [Chloroflexota bacterium]